MSDLQEAIEEMRSFSQSYWIVYRTYRKVTVCVINRSMAHEYEPSRILSPWYDSPQKAKLALYIYALEHGDALSNDDRQELKELLEHLLLYGELPKGEEDE